MLKERLLGTCERMLAAYGPQHWWPAETPWEMIVGAILTQACAWSNVERAIANLKAAGVLSPIALHSLTDEALATLIRPSGYFNAKARKVKAFAAHLGEHYDYDLDRLLARSPADLRLELLSIPGVGPETADSIVLYAARQPAFVIDAYTRRLMPRLGLAPEGIGYDALQALFTSNLPVDTALFQEYHALIVRHCKDTCRKTPVCHSCHLLPECPFGLRRRGPDPRG